jgi:outer membrane protein assembly factor BamB
VDETRSALIVASDQYTDPGLRRLQAPASDAQALAAVLRDPGIGGFELRTLLNEPAHVVNLAVEEFFADRRPGDLLLVHFSGHGIKDQDGELYFAAPNTVLGRLGATAVAAEFVSRRMNRSRSRRVVLLLDCCYAGAFERGLVARAGTEIGIEQQFGGRGRAVITASSAMEYAFEAGELADTHEVPPSVFTSALVEGLATGDADRDQDGLVGLDELYDYVYDKVRATTPNQTPGKWTFGMEGELYIARRSRPVTTPAPLPPELQHAIDSPLAGIRARAVEELAGILRGRHAGMALAARLALERLIEDYSHAVAAAAAAALGRPAPAVPPRPPRPELALSAAVIDLGRLPQHGQSPERRVRIGNAGGGDLNARAATSASWLKLGEAGDELVVTVDTSEAGEYEGTVTVDSDGGTATVRVRARVDPAPPAPGAAATTHPEPVPETPAGVESDPQQDPALAPAASANMVPTVVETAPDPAPPAAGQAVAGPDVGPALSPDGGGHRATSPPRDDHPRVAAGGPGPGAGEKAPRAPRPRRVGRGIRRRLVIVTTAIGIAVIGLVIAITIIPGTPATPATRSTRGASVHWAYTTGSKVVSGPAVASGTVYIGSEDHKVYALDAATGHLGWTYTTGSKVVSDPAVASGTVYVGSTDYIMYALDVASGHLRWTYTTAGEVISGPAVAGGTVYIGSADHRVYALDAATGHLRWAYTTGDQVDSNPAVASGTVYVGSLDHKVYALDAATGHLRWAYTTEAPVFSGPAVASGTVYVGSSDFKVYALDAATGHLRWAYTTGNSVYSGPAAVGGTVYVGSWDHKVYALDAATGHLRWAYTTGGAVFSRPAVGGGTVYVGSWDHKVYALDAATGHLRWAYTTGGQVGSDPAVADGTVYVGSDDHKIYALNTGS